MRIQLTGFLLLLCLAGSAQKIDKDEKDEFNGGRTVSTTDEQLRGRKFASNSISVQGVIFITAKTDKSPSDTSKSLWFSVTADQVTSVDKKQKIYLKLADQSVLTFNNFGSYQLVSSGDRIYYTLLLSPDDVEILKSKTVTKIRFETTEADINLDIDEKKQPLIQNIVNLITNYKL